MALISFIIPTRNEEANIGNLLDSIRSYAQGLAYELIVVDNFSSDSTLSKLSSSEVNVYVSSGSVGHLRNIGAENARGDIFIFLDADMVLTHDWEEEVQNVLLELQNDPLVVTGSVADISDECNWIESHWFKSRVGKDRVEYMNSGHMVITQALFRRIGGFDDNLTSGEDVELCQRAKRHGCKILNNHKLRVVHNGYPKDISAFFRRERWHGVGDYQSLKNFITSKPALISLCLLLGAATSLAMSLLAMRLAPVFAFLLLFLFTCILAAYDKGRKVGAQLVVNSVLYAVYFAARAMSFFDAISSHILSCCRAR